MQDKTESKAFDKIFKENIEKIFLPFLERKLGVKFKSVKRIPEKLQTTLEREVDFILIVETEDERKFILHIEFQTDNDSDMVYRGGEYHGIILKKYRLPIFHFVVYLGSRKPSMATRLKPEEVYYGFELINLHDIDAADFLDSSIPEEIILAILGRFPRERSREVLGLIIERLKRASKNKTTLKKYIKQLLVLSRLRGLEKETFKIANNMPIIYDHTKDFLFLKGKKEGKEENSRNAIIIMLKDGLLTVEQIAKYLDVSVAFVLKIKEELEKKKG